MKLIFILLSGVVSASSQKCQNQNSIPLYNNNSETIPCLGIQNGTSFVVDKDDCGDFLHCCIWNDTCVIKNSTLSTGNPSDSKDFKDELFGNVNETVSNDTVTAENVTNNESQNSLVGARLLPIGSPPNLAGLIQKCIPPVPFPGNCRPTRNEPYVLEPPINIPYCLRIPCDSSNNKMYEKSQRACGMQSGCYFDKELSEYREAFGDSVLPGVPVCHLAIRNRFFQQKARAVVAKYGSWNPYFTNCLLNEFKDEIAMGPKGCELLPVLDTFYVIPKLAGWKNINSYECALIDGCWRKGRGCFYPVDIHSVRIKSGQRQVLFGKKEITYGKPKCQHFDVSSPFNILKSYHRCLSAGCSVDSSVTYVYYNLLYSLGQTMSVDQHWLYWDAVEKGLVGAFNLDKINEEYGPMSSFMPKKPVGNNLLGSYMPPKDVEKCGFVFKGHPGARPCAPPVFQPPHSSSYCPYKPFFVPRFPTLKGRFDGCCDINLCYLPKAEISEMHSGPSHYYSEWSLFSKCSAPCDGGEQKRSRRCISGDPKLCTERMEESKSCNTHICSPGWTNWDQWSPCGYTCGNYGQRSRKRVCLPDISHCPPSAEGAEEVETCYLDPCPDSGHGGSIFGWPPSG